MVIFFGLKVWLDPVVLDARSKSPSVECGECGGAELVQLLGGQDAHLLNSNPVQSPSSDEASCWGVVHPGGGGWDRRWVAWFTIARSINSHLVRFGAR